jgi:predicted nucleic acid-binding protein
VTARPWLIDKSALVRVADSVDVEEWNNRIERGLVHITNVTRLEIGYLARRGAGARRDFDQPPLGGMPVEYRTPAIEDRALEVRLLLGDAGKHRGPSIPDPLISATAELSGLTVLHVAKDFAHQRPDGTADRATERPIAHAEADWALPTGKSRTHCRSRLRP